MIEAVIVAQKILGVLAASGDVIARPVEPECHDRQPPRHNPFLERPDHPKREVGFALAETDLASLADQFDAQARLLCLKRQKARREKLGDERRRPADPHHPVR